MKIVLLGSGNVATHLAKAFEQAGHSILQIWSRSLSHAEALAAQLTSAKAIDDLLQIDQAADVIIIAVKDDAITGILNSLKGLNALIVHTSGSVSIDVLTPLGEQVGVLYPLQTFSKNRELDFSTIPVCIEAVSLSALQQLQALASSISSSVYELSSAQRKTLHIAAVFVCNFVNYLYTIGDNILKQEGLDFSLLRPLIQETAEKVQTIDPESAQTGPAKRGDTAILQTHLDYLKNYPDYQKVYQFLSQQLVNFYKSES